MAEMPKRQVRFTAIERLTFVRTVDVSEEDWQRLRRALKDGDSDTINTTLEDYISNRNDPDDFDLEVESVDLITPKRAPKAASNG